MKAGIAAVVVCMAVLAGCSRDAPVVEDVRPVQVQKIVRGDYEARVTYSGDVRARFETALGFRVGGKLVERYVDVGSEVKPGTLLARLDAQDLQLNTLSAQSQLAAAQSDFDQARADLARYKELFEKKFISQAEYDRRVNIDSVAQARLEQAKAQLGVTRNQAVYSQLRADRAGVITAVEAEAGQVVAAGQTVMKIARLEEKEVVISVPEHRLAEVQATQQIAITLWAYPNRPYQGRVREISPGADAVTRTYTVKVAVLDADANMRLGMTATVQLQRQFSGEITLVPLGALYQKEREAAVWVVDPASGSVRLAPVVVGEYRESTVTVTSGLKDGDLVVTAGVHKLVPGQKVRIQEAGARK
jgi:multidrug efflux system membrane fusion protein